MLNRRTFLNRASAAALAFTGLRTLLQPGFAQDYKSDRAAGVDPYGELLPDPRQLLDLPPGFSYKVFSLTGEPMSDGLLTPGRHDGMAAFPIAGVPHKCALVRNHEIRGEGRVDGPFGNDYGLLGRVDATRIYDFTATGVPLCGGTTTLIYDLQTGIVERSFLSLAGTEINCAGGPTPWGSWLSCEESDRMPGPGARKPHGYIFEVPAAPEGLVQPVPLKAMGRFVHEAAAVDPITGIVYLTEDSHDGLFYRFLPDKPGQLQRGRLQALALRTEQGADLRNWRDDGSEYSGAGKLAGVGQTYEVEWIDIKEPESPDNDLRLTGFRSGALRFARGEGIAYGRDKERRSELFFTCTTGGGQQIGQVWRYRPSPREGTAAESVTPGRLQLFVETDNPAVLESCDNVVVAPWGDLILCEDGSDEQYLRGVTPQGKLYTLARNAHPLRSEFAGACFAPDGNTLFVNLQEPGMTFAIRGPWTQRRTA